MAVTGNPEEARSLLRMIAQAPFNAEAPPEALKGEITPTELHYVRSNFAVPPVEISSIPRSVNWRAKSTSPDLSVTLSSARWILAMV